MSFSGAGGVLLLSAFGLGFDSEDAAGLVIALELKLFGGKKPIAIGILNMISSAMPSCCRFSWISVWIN